MKFFLKLLLPSCSSAQAICEAALARGRGEFYSTCSLVRGQGLKTASCLFFPLPRMWWDKVVWFPSLNSLHVDLNLNYGKVLHMKIYTTVQCKPYWMLILSNDGMESIGAIGALKDTSLQWWRWLRFDQCCNFAASNPGYSSSSSGGSTWQDSHSCRDGNCINCKLGLAWRVAWFDGLFAWAHKWSQWCQQRYLSPSKLPMINIM